MLGSGSKNEGMDIRDMKVEWVGLANIIKERRERKPKFSVFNLDSFGITTVPIRGMGKWKEGHIG